MIDAAQNDELAYLYDRLRTEATALLTQTGLVTPEQITLASPKPNIPADLAFPVFASAKASGAGNPNQWAQTVAQAVVLLPDGLIGKVEPAGGFVNFSVSPERFAREAIAEVVRLGADFGKDASVGANQTVIVEYSSPNIAKKLHIGSLRTTVIGHSLYLILQALGYRVIGDNHLGDWGTQFGYILSAIHDGSLTPWNDPDPVASLMKTYSEYYLAANGDAGDPKSTPPRPPIPATNPEYKDRAREWFKKLEDGDEWARQTWQTIIALSLAEFDKLYKRLDINFDTQIGESYFEPVLQPLVQEALDKGVATYGEGGAVVVDFGEGGLPLCLLRKSDGATLYQTRDAATCIYRWKTYHPARNIYVVGAEQKLHFQQVFEIARRMGYMEIADRSIHIPFGMVTGASGQRFSTRKGNVIFADEILDEAVSRARANVGEQIASGKTELTASDTDEINTVAETLGLGAVIYADLFQGPDRNIAFDWDKILSNDGNTAAYIQYTHARCRSILRKAGGSDTTQAGANPVGLLTTPEEQAVLKQLAKMPHAVRDAGEKFLPASVAEWTYALAREFARFYHEHSVLEAATPELRLARLTLVAAVAQGLQNGLALLGIGAPERM